MLYLKYIKCLTKFNTWILHILTDGGHFENNRHCCHRTNLRWLKIFLKHNSCTHLLDLCICMSTFVISSILVSYRARQLHLNLYAELIMGEIGKNGGHFGKKIASGHIGNCFIGKDLWTIFHLCMANVHILFTSNEQKLMKIVDIGGHFEKWPPFLSKAKSAMAL